MADALCGPSNALQNFQKHTSVDQTLQQDRISSRQSPAQGFRSSNQAQGQLDAEFNAFEAGYSTPLLAEQPNLNTFLPPPPQFASQPSADVSGWATDFQNLHIAGPSLQQQHPQHHIRAEASILQANSTHRQHEPIHGVQQTPQSTMFQGGMAYRPGMGMLGNPGFARPDNFMPATTESLQHESKPAEVFDESAFEAAFAEARAEVELQESTLQQQIEPETSLSEPVEEVIRIGSDNIPASIDGINESDELSRTAGELLDRVSHDQSQKFKESNFLALMRQLRDREIVVDGDGFRKTSQPLHPGGPFYPEQRKPSGNITIPTTIDFTTHNDTHPQQQQHPHSLEEHIPSEDISDEPSPLQQQAEDAVQPSRELPDLTIVDNNNSRSNSPPPLNSLPSDSSSNSPSPLPPSFSSLYSSADQELDRFDSSVTESGASSLPAFAPAPPFEEASPSSSPVTPRVVTETKAELSRDKGESSGKGQDDGEPPPPYTEGSIPLQSFTYVMAAAGGAASIITQVQQTGGPPLNSLGDIGGDEHITLDLRGMRFTLSRDELLTLPEFVLLSLFPNGLLPDGHMGSFHEGDVYPVDYDPLSLQYMLDFFRTVAQSIPSSSPSPTTSAADAADPIPNPARDMLQDRAGIIVLREDLDFYTIPPTAEIEHPEMMEIKRAAGRALLKQDGIFSGLRKSDEPGSTEQHLIEMLTAGGFNHDDRWGHRADEPNKAVICSLALAKLRTDIRGDLANSNAVGMAQKLLLFWRKPARRCWWEGVELDNVEGVEGKLKVWIRRVWTLEMSVIGLR
ncbi:uncharacterized protein GIQ15_01531 [Arthroderma uncinatum]|uniref:uncharacterized protein n=1 Tax=Arthroderma uncinatum TaxID=74035 RepID=UPI00144ADC94|nr:uncharacterized protein GIQ15_01531 [Arthroderma uncinatum]KAF3492014.1 hypothetical protein GIQ15_01531 [Arthroderma uncinatum]